MKKKFDLEQLRIFLTVVEVKHLNVAASILSVTPSAVSQAIHKLESSLETELFYHGERPFRLTPAGARLVKEGRPILSSADSLQASFLNMDAPKINLRIGLGESMSATISPWLMGTVISKVAQIEVYTLMNKPLTKMLKNGELDACIYSEGLLNEPQWVRVPLFEEEYLFVCSKDIPPVRTMEDFRQVASQRPYISYIDMSHDRELTDAFLSLENIRPCNRIQVATTYLLVGLICTAGGWSFLPPTNLWGGGAFAKQVNFTSLPSRSKYYRRMWAIGYQDKEDIIHRLGHLSRHLFMTHIVPELKNISPDMTRYIRMLPE